MSRRGDNTYTKLYTIQPACGTGDTFPGRMIPKAQDVADLLPATCSGDATHALLKTFAAFVQHHRDHDLEADTRIQGRRILRQARLLHDREGRNTVIG